MFGSHELFSANHESSALNKEWGNLVGEIVAEIRKQYSFLLFNTEEAAQVLDESRSDEYLLFGLTAYTNREAQRQAAGAELKKRWSNPVPGTPLNAAHLKRAVLKSIDENGSLRMGEISFLRDGKASETIEFLTKEGAQSQHVMVMELLRIVSISHPIYQARFQQLLDAYNRAEARYFAFFEKNPSIAELFRND